MKRPKHEKATPTKPPAPQDHWSPEKYSLKGGNFTPLKLKVVTLADPDPSAGYDEWEHRLKQLGPISSPRCLAFVLSRALYRPHWLSNPANAADPKICQLLLDHLYPRRDPDVDFDQRLTGLKKLQEGVKLDMVCSTKAPDPKPALKPKLKLPQPVREITLDIAEAYEKQAIHVPKQNIDNAPRRAKILYECFMKQFNDEQVDLYNVTMPTDSVEMKKIWWNNCDNKKKQDILTPQAHPDGVPPGELGRPVLPLYTSLFAPIFQTILIKMMGAVNPNIIFNTRMTWEELNGLIDAQLSGHDFTSLEADFCNYDELQDDVMLELQCLIFDRFHMPYWMIDTWRHVHKMCIMTTPKFGVSYQVGFHCRSGDFLTWFGNTIVLLAIFGYLYPIEKAHLVILGGDHNIAFFPPSVKLNLQCQRAAEELNFECKALSFTDSLYYCSRFIIPTRFGWITVADPVKLVIQLGRSDLQGHAHIEAIHDSWKRLHYFYLDQEVREALNVAACSRYSKVLNKKIECLSIFIDTISEMVADVNVMKSFYSGTPKEWALKLDPNEKEDGGLYETLVGVFSDEFKESCLEECARDETVAWVILGSSLLYIVFHIIFELMVEIMRVA